MSSVKQTPEQFRYVAQVREYNLAFKRMAHEERLRDPDQRRHRRKKPQPIPDRHIGRGRHLRLFEVVERRAEREGDLVVRAAEAVNDDLRRDDGILRMKQERLLWRQVPLVAETLDAITRAKLPERGIPRRAVSLAHARMGRDQPPLHDLLNETALKQPFAIGAAEFL